MNLQRVLDGVVYEGTLASAAKAEVAGLAYDSRQVNPGFLFFAFPGAKADGRAFAAQAIERGALAVVSQSAKPSDFDGLWLQVAHGRQALALSARNFFGAPDEKIAVTGITGTNGKTTTSYLVDSLLRSQKKKTALIGTIAYHLAGKTLPSVNTTPESLDLYRMMSDLRALGGTHLTMETSSHALALGRPYGIHFHTAIFMNLTRDHLDFHHTMEEYFAAKEMLFNGMNGAAPQWAVINADDEWGRRIQTADGVETLWYGIGERATVRATEIQSSFDGLHFTVQHDGQRVPIESPLLGRINVYNLLAAYCAGISLGLSPAQTAAGLRECRAVPGRFERVDEGQPFLVLVDYAHTDDALRNAILAARDLDPKRVITLFGCGGDRDRTKRPLMGKAAGELSDYVVLTSDNPRSEEPLDIIMDALVGLRRSDTPHLIEPDRERAIRKAIESAQPGDVVILAGKGHETYQITKTGSAPFDDREVARKVLRGFGYKRKPA